MLSCSVRRIHLEFLTAGGASKNVSFKVRPLNAMLYDVIMHYFWNYTQTTSKCILFKEQTKIIKNRQSYWRHNYANCHHFGYVLRIWNHPFSDCWFGKTRWFFELKVRSGIVKVQCSIIYLFHLDATVVWLQTWPVTL